MAPPIPSIMIVDDEAPARARLKLVLGDIAGVFPHRIAAEAATGKDALAAAMESSIDIAIVDVQMPAMTGLELAQHLIRLPQPPVIIFATAFDEFALKAFEVHALDYLLKPVRAQRLRDALERAWEMKKPALEAIDAAARDRAPSGRSVLSVSERGRLVLVPVADILYLKAELKYVTIRTAERELLTEESLSGLEEEFAGRFVRIHRNALVARAAVEAFERVETPAADDMVGEPHWVVVLRGLSERLPVSRRQWPTVKGILGR